MKMGSELRHGGTKEPPMHADSRRSTTPRWNHRWTRMDTDRASPTGGWGIFGRRNRRCTPIHADPQRQDGTTDGHGWTRIGFPPRWGGEFSEEGTADSRRFTPIHNAKME